MLSPTRSDQNSLFSNFSDEDQKHIDAIRPHFNALKTKYTREQIYTLLTLDHRSSYSSFGTRSSTPSTQRTLSSLDFHSSSNASFRSSRTSFTSAGTSSYAQSNEFSTPYNRPESYNANAHIALVDSKPDLRGPLPEREASAVSDAGPATLCCPFPDHKKSTFSRKADYKMHMNDYHKPGPSAWLCQQKGCKRQFETEPLFRQHHASEHQCRRSCTHADQSKISVPPKLAFACGFEGCAGLFTNWDHWRDHVCDHLLRGTNVSSWKYTVELRNLLRRREISSLWNSCVEQRLGAPQGYQQIFLWEPSTTSHLKEYLEFSTLHYQREELIDEIFRAAVSASPRREQQELSQQPIPSTYVNPPPTSLSTATDFGIPESNAVQSLAMSDLARDSSYQTPAFDISYTMGQYPHFQFTNYQQSFDPMVNSVAPGLSQAPLDLPWNGEAMNLIASSSDLVSAEFENQPVPERQPAFWFPNVPNNPLAAYGLPPNATSFQAGLAAKADQQHARSKSSSKNSLGKKISGYFSSGRKATHSSSDSDGSDQRMGGVQTYY